LQFNRFFGREREIAEIERLVLAPDVRLITLSGPGGTGKTRLAIEAAGRLLDSLSGAVWFVPLADLTDTAFVASAMADALCLPRHDGDATADPFEQVIAALSRHPSEVSRNNKGIDLNGMLTSLLRWGLSTSRWLSCSLY
jgi:predicted ATPase